MDIKTIVTLLVSVFLAFVGYLVTYFSNKRLTQRKERLDRTDRQLRDLYGPLYALTESGEKSWAAFRQQIGRSTGSFWHANPGPTQEERAAWRLWMKEVLMPLNVQIESVLVQRTDLLEGNEMPECLLKLLSHIAAYKAVLKGWENGDYSRHISVIDYPADVNRYVKAEYLKLKSRQQLLIGANVLIA